MKNLIKKIKQVELLALYPAIVTPSRTQGIYIWMNSLVLESKSTKLEGLDNTQKEDCKDLQDCVLTIHHLYMQTFAITNALKIVENHMGNAMIINAVGGKR